MWREQIDCFSAHGYRVIAPDLRGFGESSDKLQPVVDVDRCEPQRQAEACPTVTTMEDMARDVAALMDELEIDRAAICGLSMGGYVAFEFVHLFPSRTSGLVLAGTRAPADNDEERQSCEQQGQRILAEGMNGIADARLPKLLAPRPLALQPNVLSRGRVMIFRADPHIAPSPQR